MDPLQEFKNLKAGDKKLPDLRPGDTVRVYQRIKEGDKERVQMFEGMVIRKRGGKGLDGTFTVRKISFGVGVEKIFPYHMPQIEKIEITRRGEARRAKLYYLRDRQIKSSKLQGQQLSEEDQASLTYKKADPAQQAKQPAAKTAEKSAAPEAEAKQPADKQTAAETKDEKKPATKNAPVKENKEK